MTELTIDFARDGESIARWSEDFSRLEQACDSTLPFIRTTRSIAGVRVTGLSFLGADPGLTEVRSAHFPVVKFAMDAATGSHSAPCRQVIPCR